MFDFETMFNLEEMKNNWMMWVGVGLVLLATVGYYVWTTYYAGDSANKANNKSGNGKEHFMVSMQPDNSQYSGESCEMSESGEQTCG